MHCSCPTIALRIFIRSITRVQIDPGLRNPASQRIFGTFKQFSRLANGHNSAAEEWPATDRPALHDVKALEKSAKWSTKMSELSTDALNLHQPKNPRQWSRVDRTNGGVDGELQGAKDYPDSEPDLTSQSAAVLEITPESIDALAFEFLEDSAKQQSDHSRRGPASRNSFRRDVSTGSRQYRRDSNPADRRNPRSEAEESEIAYRPKEPWQIQKATLREKFAEGWNPRKRLSPDALKGIRAIHAQYPLVYTTAVLAEKFEVSAEAIRRILKSKWTPKEEEEADRTRRWHVRGTKVWSRWADLGMKPPARWRGAGVGRVEHNHTMSERHPRESHNFRDRQAVETIGGRRRERALMKLTTEPSH